jgi:hypothetical protein
MNVTITPITDHEQYSVNGHLFYKDSSGRWNCRTPMSATELNAFERYKKLIVDNPRFKTHIKSTYKS